MRRRQPVTRNRVAGSGEIAGGAPPGGCSTPRHAIAGSVWGCDSVQCVKRFTAFTRYVCIYLIVPFAGGNRSMFAFLLAVGAVFLAVAVAAAISLAGPSQWR
jgi:hypothetical protein